jgi:phage replication initiation protein
LFAPRSCNTGAQISQPSKSSRIDWLEFTVKGVSPEYAVAEYLALEINDFTLADYGMQGYSDCYVYGFVKVLFSPEREERGTKIILSATALDEVGRDGLEIIKLVLRDGGTFARIDLALDDRSGLLDIDRIWQTELDGQTVCHFKEVSPIKKFNRHSRKLVANGVNFGSRCSSRFIRCYDKQLEQLNKNLPDPGQWVRIELQSNKRGAYVVAQTLAVHGLRCIPSIVSGALDFRERSQDDNSTRCERLSWWDEYLGAIESIKTGAKKAVSTIEKKTEWLSKQCRKTMGQVAVAFDSQLILDMVMSGIKSTTKKEWEILFPDRNIEDFFIDVNREVKPCPF